MEWVVIQKEGMEFQKSICIDVKQGQKLWRMTEVIKK